MATYRYLVTVETTSRSPLASDSIQSEIDSNLESAIFDIEIEHFTVEPLPQRAYPGQGFDGRYDLTAENWQDRDRPAPLSPDGRYQS